MPQGRVLLYQALYGGVSGEDRMFFQWRDLLEEFFQVDTRTPKIPSPTSFVEKLDNGLQTIWNHKELLALDRLLQENRYDIVVFGNLEVISPAALLHTRKRNIKTVVILHNYKPICAQGSMFRQGEDCTLCPAKDPLSAIKTNCVRGRFSSSLLRTIRTELHKHLDTYNNATLLLCPSRFQFNRLTQFGLSTSKALVFPNWVSDTNITQTERSARSGYLFAGRLEQAKGIDRLLTAWCQASLDERHRLTVAGQGPLLDDLRQRNIRGVSFCGEIDSQEIQRLMASSVAVIVPSIVNEVFGLTAAEALSAGTPIITTRAGGLSEINCAEVGEFLEEITPPHLEVALQAIDSNWEQRSRAALLRFQSSYSLPRARKNWQELQGRL